MDISLRNDKFVPTIFINLLTLEQFSKFRRILIIRLSSLGDILLTTPLLRAIKNHYPSIELDYLVRPEYADALKFNPYINKLHFYNRESEQTNILHTQLKETKYNLIIDLQNNLRSKVLSGKLSREVVRFNKKSIDKFLLVKFKINRLKDSPQIPFRYAAVVPGLSLDEKGIELITDKTFDSRVNTNKTNIGLCPGARHFTKRWPEKYFIELGKKLVEQNFQVLLFGGRTDRKICEKISQSIPGSIDLSNDDNLLQTTANMQVCSVVVCNDSGLMHTASASKVKVLAIFGSTVKEFGFTPYNCDHLILENNSLTCRPCSHIGRESCPQKHFNCMNEIYPAKVFEKVLEILKH